jgi:hypothetical protein
MQIRLAITAMNKYLPQAAQLDSVSSFLKTATIAQCLRVRSASKAEAARQAVHSDMSAGGE